MNRDYNRDPNIKAHKRFGFMNDGSTSRFRVPDQRATEWPGRIPRPGAVMVGVLNQGHSGSAIPEQRQTSWLLRPGKSAYKP